MTTERTLSIIKPDAVKKNLIGEIYSRIEKSGLKIISAKMLRFSKQEAQAFYAEHTGKDFFNGLIEFMTSGPIMVQAIEGENAISKYRELMGATDSREAARGTIRKDLGQDNRRNAVHGSDSVKSAQREIEFFFKPDEIF
jgi:nucleoside-diphosphate kinase